MRSSLRKLSSFGDLRRKQESAFWTTVLLLPTFVQRLFIGGEAVYSYDEFQGVSLIALGYVCHLAIVLKFVVAPPTRAATEFVLKPFATLAAVSSLHVLLLLIEHPPGTTEAVLSIVRLLLWLLCCLAIVQFTSPDQLLNRLVQLTHITFAVVAVTYAIFVVTNVPFQILLSNGEPRAQGLLSEPSGMGCLLAGYVGLATAQRRWMRVATATAIAMMTSSVIALIGLLLGLLSGFARLKLINPRWRTAVFASMYLAVPVALVAAPRLSQEIANTARDTMQYVNTTTIADNSLYTAFGLRVLQAASLMDIGVELVTTGDNISEGGLFRFTSALLLLDRMQQSWRLYTGFGLGAHAQLMLANDESILDFGLYPLLLSSFGAIGSAIVFGWLAWTVCRDQSSLAAYAVPFGVVCSFNSAGGIHAYTAFLVAVFLISRSKQFESHRKRGGRVAVGTTAS